MVMSSSLRGHARSLQAWSWGDKIVPCLLLLAAFLFIGYFTGWVVGASRAPIASAVVPVGVGLLGSISFALFERRSLFDSFLKSVKGLEDAQEIQEGALAKVQDVIGGPARASFWPPAIWGVGAAAFCLACLVGIWAGIEFRVPKYRPFLELLGQVQLTTDDRIELTRLEWHSKATNVPVQDYESVFHTAIGPILTEDIPVNVEECKLDDSEEECQERTRERTAEEKLAIIREKKSAKLSDLVDKLVAIKRDLSTTVAEIRE